MNKAHVTLMSAVLLLVGCGTPERQQARSQCHGEAAALFPPAYEQRLVTRTRAVETPTGKTTCTTVNNGNVSTTNCVSEKRTEYLPYTVSQTFDANERSRLKAERACADRVCLQRYGNPECKN